MLEKRLLIELQAYVERHLNRLDFALCESPRYVERNLSENMCPIELEDFIKNTRKPTFNQVLFSFIDKKGARDSDIYKRAGIDRRLFSKIRSNPNYKPGKNTAIALAMAIELNKNQIVKLLGAAGYSLSESDTFDLVIQFCLEKKIYNLHDINQALDYFSLKPLAGVIE
ncbi:MAG: helix-turn-helix domain-containing protein [Desulfitobacteriaceae bacterium]